MTSAIDVFREQREAADQVQERLTEISQLVGQLNRQVNALAMNEDLRKVLREEQDWLRSAQLGCVAGPIIPGGGDEAILARRGRAVGPRPDLRVGGGWRCRRQLCARYEAVCG
jgi:hypothetical protein